MVAGAHDKQVPPDRVRAAYDDLGATEKVLIDLGCSSHNAMWEKNHLLLFSASLEWLKDGHRRRHAQRRASPRLSRSPSSHARQLRHRLRQRHAALGRVLSRRHRPAA